MVDGAQDLADLRHHWSGAYLIHHSQRRGLWLAIRRDNRETIRAEDPEQLRRLIRSNYAARRVAR